MSETWNKREREKKKQMLKKQKVEKKLERKDKPKNGNDLDSMMAYIDENGNLSATPPDPRNRRQIKAEDIEIGVPRQVYNPEDDAPRTGLVTHFNNDKGYGFIRDSKTGESIFVHVNSVTGALKEKDNVIFEVEMGMKGANAVNVKIIP